jgi:adenylate cyclase, class 2
MLAHVRLGNTVPDEDGSTPRGRASQAKLYSAMLARSPTRRETEIKLRIVDLPALIHGLHRLGAVQHGRVLERNTLYDTPDSDFRLRGRLLRVRLETPAPSKTIPGGARRSVITSKAPVPALRRSRYKQKLEREVAVGSATRWPAILRALGLRAGFRYEKYRTTFRLPGLHLDLDETPAGVYLEIEGAPRAIDRVARALGFAPQHYIRGTYWDLHAADCRRRGRAPRNMLF